MKYQINKGSKSFGANTLFENIQFEVRNNEKIAVIGTNGCGKTTLIKCLLQLIPYQGQDCRFHHSRYRFKCIDHLTLKTSIERRINLWHIGTFTKWYLILCYFRREHVSQSLCGSRDLFNRHIVWSGNGNICALSVARPTSISALCLSASLTRRNALTAARLSSCRAS